MIIHRANLNDISYIERTLSITCFGERKPDWERVVNDSKSLMLVMEDEEKIIGFSGMEWQEWQQAFELVNVYVNPDYRNQGLGKQLLTVLIDHANAVSARAILGQTSEESGLSRLLEKVGFELSGYHNYWYDNAGSQKAVFYTLKLR